MSLGILRRAPSSPQVLPLAITATALLAAIAAVILSIADRALVVDVPVPDPAGWFVPVQVSSALIWIGASWALLQRRDLAWSRLAAVAALSHAGVAVTYAWGVHGLIGGHTAPGAASMAAMAFWLMPVEMPVSIFMTVSLPSGRLSTKGIDRFGWLAVAMASGGVLVEALSDPDVAGTDFAAARNPLSLGFGPSPIVALLIAPAALLSVVVLIVKWRRTTGSDRLAMRWVVWLQLAGTLVVVPLIAFAPPELSIGVAQVASALGLLVLVTVIRRQHLLGVERLLERTLRSVLLIGVLALLYALVIALGSEVIGGWVRPLAAAAVALAALPLRDRLGDAVARFVYGDRLNAADIVAGVAEQASRALTPAELIERFLHDLVAGTGSGGAAVDLVGHGPVATVGTRRGPEVGRTTVALRIGGAEIGQVTLLPAEGELCVDAVAEGVLRGIAPHMAIVADAHRADIELQLARVRLVQGREEERRRLRHDLHDGLGPILTGAAFSADAASNLVARDPAAAIDLIAAVRGDVGTALNEIRRIVEDLRPPALDELGLTGAIRQHAQRLPQLEVTVSELTGSPRLPAAVEVAAYRIATEALTNVARHSGATHASVDVAVNGSLFLRVTDNGPKTNTWPLGVGLTSMAERARELGGSLVAGPSPTGGSVSAALPVTTR